MAKQAANSLFKTAPQFWEKRGLISLFLWPLSWLYGLVIRVRHLLADLSLGGKAAQTVPIIIVGNIRVGGTGKTPIVIALAELLSSLGWKPGIISRGYGAHTLSSPTQVDSQSNTTTVGDEPVLIAKRTHDRFPIWVFPKRKESIAAMLSKDKSVDVIISDDGLQHTGLVCWPAREGGRDIEFVVRDQRGEGNGFLIPAGPLREPASRERDATLITGLRTQINDPDRQALNEVISGGRTFHLSGSLERAYQLTQPSYSKSLKEIADDFSSEQITAVAGIGHPQRFFDDLAEHGIRGSCIALPDHAHFDLDFFKSITSQCILITEKDAVKCADIPDERIWVVPMSLVLPEGFSEWMQSILQRPDPRHYT
jgi:tetraacyldisaccharide 4'-kinase